MPVSDPMAIRLQRAALRGGPDPREILSIPEVFGEELADHPPFVAEVGRSLASFFNIGVRATLTGQVAS